MYTKKRTPDASINREPKHNDTEYDLQVRHNTEHIRYMDHY